MTVSLETVATIVIHTPIWVWPLYALLLFLGLQRTRDSTLALWRVLMLPLVVALLALWSFISAGSGPLPAMLLGLVIGSTAGLQLERHNATRRLPDGKIWVRGEWWSFVLILAVLIFRYATSVVQAMDPGLNADLTWHLGTLFISTVLSGLFLGRTAARLRVYFAAVPAGA